MSSVMRFDEWQDSNGNAVATGTGGVFSAPGSVLQVVRATDTTLRSTTSTSFVDVTGMSVTITPKSASSEIIVMANFRARATSASSSFYMTFYQITDSSNSALSGAEEILIRDQINSSISADQTFLLNITGFVNAVDTSARTYKLRFKALTGITAQVQNANNTGEMYAIEVAA